MTDVSVVSVQIHLRLVLQLRSIDIWSVPFIQKGLQLYFGNTVCFEMSLGTVQLFKEKEQKNYTSQDTLH